jgi:hypothetical protein
MIMIKIKIFDYIEKLDAFVPTRQFKEISDYLGLTEWHCAEWIGRLFYLDNDYGEHWFDNWDLRDKIKDEAESYGFEYDKLLIIDPERFKNGKDGPCNKSNIRKVFWTDVLDSLTLSLDLIIEKARLRNDENKKMSDKFPDDEDYKNNYISNLDERIYEIRSKYT